MEKWIPDGDYDVDFSGLFRANNSDFFGMKYGFKPDTIDETQPSQLYIEDEQWYLVTKSKAYGKSIATCSTPKDIYFEGKCTQSITPLNLQNQETPGLSIVDQNSTAQGNELLLSFDSISKTFKANPIGRFVKMIKSREPEKIQSKISKLKKQQTMKASLFLDSFLERISKQHKVSKSPIKTTDHIKIQRKEAMPSNNVVLNKLSPVRRNPPTFPVASPNINSPTFSIPSPTASIPSPTRSPHSVSKSALLPLTQKRSKMINSNSANEIASKASTVSTSPISRVITPNGGTGTKKTQKSLLLRKAERAIGLNNATTSRLKKVDKSPATTVRNSGHKTPIVKKKREQVGNDISVEREMKEAKSDQTAFELVLLPPEKSRENNGLNQPNKVDIKRNMTDVSDKKTEIRLEEKEFKTLNLPSQDAKDISDDFEMDLSDWEDTDAIGASEIPPQLASGFSLIIEENPFQNKRDEKRFVQSENSGQKVSHKVELRKVDPNVDVKTLTTQKKSEEMKKSTSSTSVDNDQELDAELDRVFDDIKFDDEMSEEE